MGKQDQGARPDVAALARQVLAAHREGQDASDTITFRCELYCHDAFEAEKMDVLSSAVESLKASRPERVRAAIHLLEHLAGSSAARPTR